MEIRQCSKFTLKIHEDAFSVHMEDAEVFHFNVRTAVHAYSHDLMSLNRAVYPQGGADKDTEYMQQSITEDGENLRVVWTTSSNQWRRKEYILECDSTAFRYYVRVYGSAPIGKVEFFGLGANPYDASGYFSPEAMHEGKENRHFTMSEPHILQLGYMVPPPFCYSFFTEGIDTRFGIALTAKPGEYNFDHFRFQAGYDTFSFSTDYYGYQRPSGTEECFETGHIMGFAGEDDLDVLRKYSEYSFDYGYAVRRSGPKADWWTLPLFCGWGEQGSHANLAPKAGADIYDCACQSVYEEMVRILEEKNLPITTVIIDDKWQKYYGIPLPDPEKWPDMRAFVDAQHAKGRKVVLWYKVWNGEGLTNEEQIQCLCRPAGADPTSAAYAAHMKEAFYKILSPDDGCFNCDGFKFDFANCMPLGEMIYPSNRRIYGVELLKRMFKLLYDCTKSVKPDALVNNSCCHPYFAEVTDQVRLHDYATNVRNAHTTLDNRFNVFHAVMPEAVVI